jgi:hypothetical protein
MANVGGGHGIWRDTTGTNPKTFNLKTLVAGTNITITSSTNTITISAIDTDTQYLMANVGTGTGTIWRDTTGTNPKTFNLKTLVAGANITITNGTDTITIAATNSQYQMANVGTGTGTIWRNTTGTNPQTFNLKTLVAGANISIINGTDTITIAATDTDTQYLMANVGTGTGQIWRDTTGTNPRTFNLKTLVAGANITITNGTDTITISSIPKGPGVMYGNHTGGIAVWEIEGGAWTWQGNSYLTAPQTVYPDREVLYFWGDEFTFEADPNKRFYYSNYPHLPVAVYASRSQSAHSLYAGDGGPYRFAVIKTRVLPLLRVVGSPEHWTSSDINTCGERSSNHTTTIQFFSTSTIEFRVEPHPDFQFGAKIYANCLQGSTDYQMANVGTGTGQIWRDTTGTNPKTFNLKTLVAGTNVTITNGTDTITIAATDTDTQYLMASVGGGYNIWRDITGTNPKTFNMKTLIPGDNISFVATTDSITISATNTDTQYNVNNLGPGLGWYAYTSGTNPKTLNFRSIVAGNNIILSHTSDQITVAAKSYQGNNVGPGYGIYRDTTGTDPLVHNFRSLVAGPGISITDSPDFLLISAPGGGGGGNTDYVERWVRPAFIDPISHEVRSNVDPDATYHVPIFWGCRHISSSIANQWINVESNVYGSNHYWYIENIFPTSEVIYEVKIFLYIRVDDACFDPPSNSMLPVIPLKPQLRLYCMKESETNYIWDSDYHLTNAEFWDLLDVYTEPDVWQQVYVNTQDALMSMECMPINPCLTKFMLSMLPRHYYIRLEGSALIPANSHGRKKWFPVFGYDQMVRGGCRPSFTLETGYLEIKLVSQSSQLQSFSDGPCPLLGNNNPFSW